jgi:hypothetical protein
MNQIAQAEKITVASTGIQALFKDQALHADYTQDGVHLNGAFKYSRQEDLSANFGRDFCNVSYHEYKWYLSGI